mmetsp:Transcript_11266/g.24905  ORF Transcript_11266/g.24905 Transcript_11266/m.24905 type:complete len:257 (-) Transcript_11266:406-1176(-)
MRWDSRRRPWRKSLAVQGQQRLHVSRASHDDRAPCMNVVRYNVQHPLNLAFKHPCGRNSSGLFGNHGHGESLVQHTQLALLGLLIRGVVENSSVKQSAVDICDHRSNIPSGVALILHLSSVLLDSVIPVQRIAFVTRVNLLASILGKLHVANQDELTDGGIQSIPPHALAPCDHQLTGPTIHRVARSDNVCPWSQNVSHFTNAFGSPSLVNSKDSSHGNIAIDVGRTVQRVKSDAIWARHGLLYQDRLIIFFTHKD